MQAMKKVLVLFSLSILLINSIWSQAPRAGRYYIRLASADGNSMSGNHIDFDGSTHAGSAVRN
jgi:hypothetical protein